MPQICQPPPAVQFSFPIAAGRIKAGTAASESRQSCRERLRCPTVSLAETVAPISGHGGRDRGQTPVRPGKARKGNSLPRPNGWTKGISFNWLPFHWHGLASHCPDTPTTIFKKQTYPITFHLEYLKLEMLGIEFRIFYTSTNQCSTIESLPFLSEAMNA